MKETNRILNISGELIETIIPDAHDVKSLELEYRFIFRHPGSNGKTEIRISCINLTKMLFGAMGKNSSYLKCIGNERPICPILVDTSR